MNKIQGTIPPTTNYQLPTILDETEDFAVIFKPPRMHSAPVRATSAQKRHGDTLLDWYADLFPPVMSLSGRKAGDGGLLHRLDFETHGLVLCAKNQSALDFLLVLQEQGNFIKEYSAIGQKAVSLNASFPPPPAFSLHTPFVIESYFRPFGPGRKQVRPVTDTHNKDCSGLYQTEVINVNEPCVFTIRLKKGFRHQIRCHLAWIGLPVCNDPVYGGLPVDNFLALRAQKLFFIDPRSGKPREYSIEPLEAGDL
jgi:23S rRNA pseudouridine1911/1915/1917 synthase